MERWREMVRYGRNITVAVLILDARTQADGFIVGKGVGVAALGQFRYAVRIATAPFQATLAVASYVLFPAFARISDDADRFASAFLRSLGTMAVVAFPAGAILVPLGLPLAVLVFGDVWSDAGLAAAAMCAYPAGGMLNSVVFEALKASGRSRELPRLNVVWTGTTLLAMLAMLPFGLTAVAAGVSFGAVVAGAYAVYVADRVLHIPLRSSLAAIWPPALAAVGMAVAMIPLEGLLDPADRETLAGIGLLGALALCGGVVYLVLLRLASATAFGELRGLAAMAVRKVTRR
jgi:PST family polysaccharide transporter